MDHKNINLIFILKTTLHSISSNKNSIKVRFYETRALKQY